MTNMTENPYIKQFPDLLNGKKLLYVHGFASSGQSGTVTRLRTVFPNATVLAPDLPIHPEEALSLLYKLCAEEQPDLIIGTSMGGMYTEQLYGYDRICVNPAMQMAETMKEHNMMGTQTFQNPRQDGVQEFYVDKALVKEYKGVTERALTPHPLQGNQELAPEALAAFISQERQRVFGLFGDEDTTVNTYDLFHDFYPLSSHFHGEHRMNDKSFMHSVVPVIRWIDDRQEKRQRPIIYIGIETMVNGQQKPEPSVQKAVRLLIERYQVFFVATAGGASYAATESRHTEQAESRHTEQAGAWLAEYIGIPAWRHTIFTWRRDLLYGDYLIATPSPSERMGEEASLCTLIPFGSDTFKTWDDIIAYFTRLGGQ